MTLRLEYTCTEADVKEAQKLQVLEQGGGGPKWRALAVYWGFIILMAVLVWFRFKTEIAPKDRWWFIALCVVAFIGLQFYKRFTQQKWGQPVSLEVSEQELVFHTAHGRAAMPWSYFSPGQETAALFVLNNKLKTSSWMIPKRAFPDEKSMEWFRLLASQSHSAPAEMVGEASAPERFVGKGINLTVELKYRDYIVRSMTSWRMRGIVFLILGIVIGVNIQGMLNPPPDAVVPGWKVCLFSLGVFIPMMAVVLLVVTYVSWRAERKHLAPQPMAFSSEGIEFGGRNGRGMTAWTAYTYYLENRWAFFVWNPRGSLWMMLPKRAFSNALEMEQVRELLRVNLKPSRWFFF